MSAARSVETLGEWLRSERVALGLTQTELARGVQVSRASIGDWESARKVMNALAHARLRQYFKWKRTQIDAVNAKESA